MRSDVLSMLHQELEGFNVSKTAVRFTATKPLPTPLIERIIRARMAEINAKPQSQANWSAATPHQ
jgi:uncharacterized protein YdhG (YjbR/CyaY superfamily)